MTDGIIPSHGKQIIASLAESLVGATGREILGAIDYELEALASVKADSEDADHYRAVIRMLVQMYGERCVKDHQRSKLKGE